MKRREFLKTSVGAAAALLSGCATDPKRATREAARQRLLQLRNRPNILWLISEDTSPDLACYGHPLVKTPNLDKLASEGARYTHAFTTAPVCSASRSAFMTGMYQTSIGAHHHRSHRSDGHVLRPPLAVITEFFRRAGYYTCNSAGLSYKRPGKTDWNFTPNARAFDGTDWSQRASGQPFFAQINFSHTHRAFVRDKKSPIDPAKVELPPSYPDHPIARRDWADYLESIQLLDTEIGVALQWLEKEGMARNTMVMYFGDNGQCHVRGKQWLYEGGIHIPMIIRWPDHIQPGTVVDDLVSTIDFAPTFLSAAGITPPEHLQGHTFLGPEKKTRQYLLAARDRCDETADRIRCVRSQRYKYIRNYYPDRPYTQFNAYKKEAYPVLTLMQVLHGQGKLTPEQAQFMAPTRPAEELYDLQNDPHELHNLADERQSRSILREHSRELDQWIKATGDQGEQPEDPKVVAYWQEEMAKLFREQMEKRGLSPHVSDEEYLRWWEKKLLG
ncbi:MAG: sulfatase-like hydrolase/transferase [Planctomycetes bacterium]|nr:sulfatase-like hydrolase/transferase [Planctomycetota bacterium]